ncbi:DsbA family oxidoreductase [Ferrimonas pelagia]|uniref:DsbA family oxidoreductase n=1 Tax=Ferrimonas pelagia TaxID=1177826 RepID=A0ABP9EUH3_9GAMM
MKTLKIDIVSDVMCPWCAIGYRALKQALENLEGEVNAHLHWQPFELAPQMAREGEDLAEHLLNKYGFTLDQLKQNQANIEQRAQALGLPIRFFDGMKKYNTFDAHRLLHWAAEMGKQTELKEALFALYFVEGGDPSDEGQLIDLAGSVGLDRQVASEVLESGLYAEHVRAQQAHYRNLGVTSVPTFIVNDKYGITGGQPVAAFEQALREIAAKPAE